MLATFVIGLREGLEASLIVGIIAAFLKQSNRSDALRKVWVGVCSAIALCLAVGLLLQLLSASLPQREQEMLECVVAAIAVVMVSYMVLWMRAHSRDLKSDLQNAAGSALARGSAGALVVMAFLAVIREGFETAVFLLAAFQSALSPLEAAVGVIVGIGAAVALGYLIYRGGIKLNLSRFFRVTGVVLVLVAAGLVMSTLRAAYEAGWLTVGQQQILDLSAVARPGSVLESLLTGMLGIRSSLPAIEVAAYLLYAIPMLLIVLWPPRRTPSQRALGRILVGTAAAALVATGLLVALIPAAPASITGPQGPFVIQGAATAGIEPATGQQQTGAAINGTAQVALSADATTAEIRSDLAGSSVMSTSTLTATGHTEVQADSGSVSAAVLTGASITTSVDAGAAGLPIALTGEQIAALNGGRLPVGVRSAGAKQSFDVGYTDVLTPVISADTATGVVLGLDLRLLRTLQVSVPNRGLVAAGTVLDAVTKEMPTGVATGVSRVADLTAQRATSQVLGQVMPSLLVVFAIVLLAFGIPKLRRAQPVVRTDDSGSADDIEPPPDALVNDLAEVGKSRQQSG